MANLDDFFKKKDNKKTKGKKFAVSNPSLSSKEPVKNGKVKQEKPTSFNPSMSTNENDLFSIQTSDEWKEPVEEEKKDYSGLKIQNLQINDDENEKQKLKQESEEETEIDESGQTVVKKKAVGPWKVIHEQKAEEAPPPAKVEPPKPEKSEASAYVPPNLRSKMVNERANRNKNDSTREKFPTLSSTVPGSSRPKTTK